MDDDLWVRVQAVRGYLGETMKTFCEKALEQRLAGLKEGRRDGKRVVIEVGWTLPGGEGASGGVDGGVSPARSGGAVEAVTPPAEPEGETRRDVERPPAPERSRGEGELF